MIILYYTDQTHLHGGIERVLANKINFLVEQKGFEVHLITTEQRGKPHCYPVSSKLITHDLGINYHRATSYFHPKNFIKVFKHYSRLREQLKKIKPDVVIIPNYDFAFYFLPFLYKKSKKIKEYHASRYFESLKRENNKSFLKKIQYRLNDYIESKYDYLVLLTPDEKQHYKSNNTIIIPNGIDVNTDKEANLLAKKVISAGRVAPVKEFEKLIDAWSIVEKEYPTWKLEIYGNGEKEYMAQLQKQINKQNLQKQVCLCGQTDNLEAKMLTSSIYVMSSITECFPMVLLEAQTMGLPIVSFNCPYGPKNIISDKLDGLLVENQNSTKLAEAILQLIASDKLRIEMGAEAKKSIQKLQQGKIMKQWVQLFNKLSQS